MFGGFFGGYAPTGRFEASYRCYPVSFIDRMDAEKGDKVFLPPSALDRLSQLQIDYPMLFKVENRQSGQATHCGVLEFIADEGMIYMPYWMMQNLVLEEGTVIRLSSATLPKGSFVKLQPHSKDFLDITNPRAVLETTLRNFTCLTVGDTVPINYNNKRYFIDIIEAKPSDAISVVETDCNVDFAPPLDYVEPEYTPAAPAAAQASTTRPDAGSGSSTTEDNGDPASRAAALAEPQFLAFAGTAKRLDGRPAADPRPVPVPRPGGTSASSAGPSTKDGSSDAQASSGASKKAGKLMYRDRLAAKFAAAKDGRGAAAPPPPPPTKASDAEGGAEKKEDGFQPFKGQGRSLRG
ncbi:hypothetical protein ACKKBG_A35820 [Auxenochlorella protothecoides x Auxenochlorella symbiontica]